MRTVWPRLTTGLAAGVMAAGLLLSGCGGDSPEPKPLPKESKSSPSASPSATPPAMPAAAKQESDRAVEAFARHYVDVINYTARSGEREPIDTLSADGCESCALIGKRAARTYAEGGRIRGEGWSISRINVVPKQSRERVYIEMTIEQAPETVVAKSGAKAKRFPGGTHTFNMVASRKKDGWTVARLDLVA